MKQEKRRIKDFSLVTKRERKPAERGTKARKVEKQDKQAALEALGRWGSK